MKSSTKITRALRHLLFLQTSRFFSKYFPQADEMNSICKLLLHLTGELEKGDTVLIHAGGSGVGVAAVQLCVLAGCQPIVTAGSDFKIQNAKDLGAVAGFNYKEVDFGDKVLEFTNGERFGNEMIMNKLHGVGANSAPSSYSFPILYVFRSLLPRENYNIGLSC